MKKNNIQQNIFVKLDANDGLKIDNVIETTTTESVIDSKTFVSEIKFLQLFFCYWSVITLSKT